MNRFISIILSLIIVLSPHVYAVDSNNTVPLSSEYEYPVSASITKCEIRTYDLYIKVAFSKLAQTCKMFAAIYTEDGRMRQTNQYTVQKGMADITVVLTEPDISSSDVIKLFFFDINNCVKPVGKSVVHSPSQQKLSGIILSSYRYNPAMSFNQVIYKITNTYENEDWEDANGNPLGGDAGIVLKIADDINANDYFGIATNIYVEKNIYNECEIVKIEPASMGKTVNIDTYYIDVFSTDDTQISYFTSKLWNNTVTYKIADNAKFFYNYSEVTSSDKINFIMEKEYDWSGSGEVEITLVENTGDNIYDMVIAKEYFYDIVDGLDAENNQFTTIFSASTFTFDFESEYINSSIVDYGGNAITLSDFSEGDVIAYLSDTNATNASNYTWIEVINLGDNTITGMVDETTSDSIYVNGTEYMVISGDSVCLGDEGVFYLTRNGRIFFIDMQVIPNYAYILDAVLTSSGFTNAWQVKMLTKDNEIVIYTVRDGIKYDGQAYNEDGTRYGEMTIPLKAFTNSHFKANPDSRVVTYKLDRNGLISEIDTAYVSFYAIDEYKASITKLGKDLEDDAVIFNIDVTSENNVFATDLSYLIDGNEYEFCIVKNANGEYDCVVLTDVGYRIDYKQNVAIVQSVTTITLDDGATNAKKVKYYSNEESEIKTIIIADDEDVSLPEGSTFSQIVPGAIMRFTDNGEGIASAYEVLATANTSMDNTSPAYTINMNAMYNYVKGNKGNNALIGGYIDSWKNANGATVLNIHADKHIIYDPYEGYTQNCPISELLINDEACVYTFYNRSASRIAIIPGDWKAAKSIDIRDSATNEATYFLAFTNDGVLTNFVTFSTRKDISSNSYYPEEDSSVDSSADSSAW